MSEPVSQAPETRRLTGYFTLFSFVRGQTLGEIENRIGYREGRLTEKGAWIYRFLRVPDESEFDLRGTSIWTDQSWNSQVAPKLAADIASEAAYNKNTRVPSFEDVLKRNASQSMALSGGNMPVKVYPLDWRPIDDTPAGYRHGSGIYQWRLKDGVPIFGKLVADLAPGGSMPWKSD
jgi:hypothetical protein